MSLPGLVQRIFTDCATENAKKPVCALVTKKNDTEKERRTPVWEAFRRLGRFAIFGLVIAPPKQEHTKTLSHEKVNGIHVER